MTEMEDAASRLRLALRRVIRRADAVSGKDAPTRSELDAMVRLEEARALTPGALAAATRVKPQTMGQTLALLDRHGWIRRAPHPTDRRQVLISLSAAGRRTLAKGRRLRQAWLAGELARLNPADRKTMVRAIAIFEQIARNGDAPSSL